MTLEVNPVKNGYDGIYLAHDGITFHFLGADEFHIQPYQFYYLLVTYLYDRVKS